MSFWNHIPERVKIIIALCASIVILLALGIYSYFMAVRLKMSTIAVNNSGVSVTKIQDFTNALNDLHFSLKDFLITSDSSVLSTYFINKKILKLRENELKKLNLDSGQVMLMLSMLKNSDKQINEYDNLIAGKIVGPDSTINSRLSAMLKYELTLLLNGQKRIQDENFKAENANFKTLTSVVIVSSIIAIIVILLSMIYIIGIYKRLNLTRLLLLKSQDRLESLIEDLPVGIVIANVSKNIFHANKKAVELLHHNIPIDGSLDSLENIKTAEDVHLLTSLQIIDAVKGQKTMGVESLVTINERSLPIRVSAIPIYHENKIEYAISVFDDITDIKKAEDELIEAKKLMEESLVLKEVFLANMSHEIRTPMNAILGFTELLLRRNLGNVENEYVSTIYSAGENLLRIIDDILDFSKLNANMMPFEETPINIRDLATNICALYDQKAVNKGLCLTYTHDKKIPQAVLADPVRLNQAITNIVSNAIKFTDKGSVKISAEVLQEDGQAVQIMFKIEDTGIGIPENKIKSVFTRFEQVLENGTHGGTGLGLSIAKHIVELSGGQISVESKVGEGSRFVFWMPFKKHLTKLEKKEKHTQPKVKPSIAKYLKILVVEDNHYNIKLLKGIFSNQNMVFDLAEDGKTTIKKLNEKKYDIILLDIELPDTNGYKLASKIRNELNISTPIIALTAHALAGEKDKCLVAGMNDYLTKPVKSDLLFERIGFHTGSTVAKQTDTEKISDPTPENTFLSLAYLKSISENNKDFEEEMLQMFIEKAVTYFESLKEAMNEHRYMAAAGAAHKLKSVLSILLKANIFPMLELIESDAKKESFTDAAVQTQKELSTIIENAVQEAKELLEKDYSFVKKA